MVLSVLSEACVCSRWLSTVQEINRKQSSHGRKERRRKTMKGPLFIGRATGAGCHRIGDRRLDQRTLFAIL